MKLTKSLSEVKIDLLGNQNFFFCEAKFIIAKNKFILLRFKNTRRIKKDILHKNRNRDT